jgi:hypothetical protein
MDVKNLTESEKVERIAELQDMVGNVRQFLDKLEKDMTGDDLKKQGVATWLLANFLELYSYFIEQMKKIDEKTETRQKIEKEMQTAEVLKNKILEC